MDLKEKYKKQVQHLENDVSRVKADLSTKQKEISITQKHLNDLNKELNDSREMLKTASLRPMVSDHAIVRYLERVCGYDIDGLKTKILTKEVISAMGIGADKYKFDGFSLVFKNNIVTTVLEN